MSTLTLKNRITILAATLLVLMAGCVTATVYGLHLSGIATRKAKRVVGIQEKFQALRICFEKSLMAPHDYLIHGSEDEKEISKGDLKKLAGKRDKLKDLIASSKVKADPELRKTLGKVEKGLLHIEKRMSEYETRAKKIMDLENPVGNPMAGPYMESMDLLVRQTQDDLEKLGMILSGIVDRTREIRKLTHRHIITSSIILSIVAVLAGAILSYYVIRSVTGPIGELVATTRKIISGNFFSRVKVERDDEIGELAHHFNKITDFRASFNRHINIRCSV